MECGELASGSGYGPILPHLTAFKCPTSRGNSPRRKRAPWRGSKNCAKTWRSARAGWTWPRERNHRQPRASGAEVPRAGTDPAQSGARLRARLRRGRESGRSLSKLSNEAAAARRWREPIFARCRVSILNFGLPQSGLRLRKRLRTGARPVVGCRVATPAQKKPSGSLTNPIGRPHIAAPFLWYGALKY